MSSFPSPPTDADNLIRGQLNRILEQRAVIGPALEAYAAELPRSAERSEVLAMARRIHQEGTADDLSETLTPPWARLVCASVRSVSPSRLIGALLQQHQAIETAQRSVVQMLAYPALVLLASLITFGLFSYFVAPVFREIFTSFQTELPQFTSFVLWSAQHVAAVSWYWYTLVVVLIAVALWRVRTFHNSQGHNRFTVICTFTDSLADLIEANVPAPEAIRVASRTANAPPFSESAERWASQLETDHKTAPIAGIPHTLIHALTCTEQPVTTANLLRELSNIFRMTQASRTRWLLVLLEPLAIVGVGVLAGFVFLAVFLPLISLLTSLTSLS